MEFDFVRPSYHSDNNTKNIDMLAIEDRFMLARREQLDKKIQPIKYASDTMNMHSFEHYHKKGHKVVQVNVNDQNAPEHNRTPDFELDQVVMPDSFPRAQEFKVIIVK